MSTTLFQTGLFSLGMLSLLSCQSVPTGQARFASPEEAFTAATDALRSGKPQDISSTLGIPSDRLGSGNSVEDAHDRQMVLDRASKGVEVQTAEGGGAWIACGPDKWLFPIPLRSDRNSQWYFDGKAGVTEVNNRYVGRNELSTLATLRGLVKAQHEYFAMDPDRDGVKCFATRIFSSPDRKDGLYWESAKGERLSPVGPMLATAENREGYSGLRTGGVPYHGYHYRILTKESPADGFAIVAWPADQGKTGVMTFIANDNGWVYEKNLGALTAGRARRIDWRKLDEGWAPVNTFDQ